MLLAGPLEGAAEEAGNSEEIVHLYYRKPISPRGDAQPRNGFPLKRGAFKDEIAAFLLAQKGGKISVPKAG